MKMDLLSRLVSCLWAAPMKWLGSGHWRRSIMTKILENMCRPLNIATLRYQC